MRAQEALIDTLNSCLALTITPFQIIDIELGLTRMYMLIDKTDSSRMRCIRALNLAHRNNLPEEEANALTFMAMLDYDSVFDYYTSSRKAINAAKKSGSKDALAFATYVNLEFADDDATKSIPILLRLLEEDSTEISLKTRANLLKALAIEFEQDGEFGQAEIYYSRAKNLFSTIRDLQNK